MQIEFETSFTLTTSKYQQEYSKLTTWPFLPHVGIDFTDYPGLTLTIESVRLNSGFTSGSIMLEHIDISELGDIEGQKKMEELEQFGWQLVHYI